MRKKLDVNEVTTPPLSGTPNIRPFRMQTAYRCSHEGYFHTFHASEAQRFGASTNKSCPIRIGSFEVVSPLHILPTSTSGYMLSARSRYYVAPWLE